MAHSSEYNDPFYFAIPNRAPAAERAAVPQHLRERFGFSGRIEFVRQEPTCRLYRIFGA